VAVGEGAAVFVIANEVTQEQRLAVQQLLESVCSAVIEAPDDEAVDLATALHGSGPAYVYLVIESMVDAAVRLGMKRADASALVLATVAGSARYAMETGIHPAELKNAVTSPGGTTAAALRELESAGLRAAFDEAIEAAFERARELGEMS
jgi:pyrroline-5-carboxylate reductase